MELRDIETFLVLADELHFGRTAKRLHVTQGRVSQTIRSLEREVGAALFERTSRSVRLTALGERFRSGAQRGYDELNRTLAEARAAARDITAELSVGYLPSIGSGLLARVAASFEKLYPQCRLVLSAAVDVRPDAFGWAPRPTIDLALIWVPGGLERGTTPVGRTVGPVLGRSPRGLLVPVGHPLAGRDAISVEDLADYEMLNPSNAWSSAFRSGWTPTVTPSGRAIRYTVDDVATMTGRTEITVDDVLTLVARGRGLHCTIITLLDRFPFPGLTLVPISDLSPLVVVPIWETAAENATIRAFVEAARTVFISDGNRDMSN